MPGQNKNQDGNDIINSSELMENVVKAYQSCDQPSLRSIAGTFHITVLKVRKLLITAKVYETPVSKEVAELFRSGISIPEIQEQLCLSRASVHSYLPYTKTVYKQEKNFADAGQKNICRERQQAVVRLTEAIENITPSTAQGTGQDFKKEAALELDNLLWGTLLLFQSYPFHTAKNLEYTYTLKGNEMFVSRKDKSITRATIALAFQNALDIQRAGSMVDGPKKLKTFGASYLYPVFIRIGIIPEISSKTTKDGLGLS